MAAREFCHGNWYEFPGKIPVIIPWFLLALEKKKSPSVDSLWFGLYYGVCAIVYFSLVTLFCLFHRGSCDPRESCQGRKEGPGNFECFVPNTWGAAVNFYMLYIYITVDVLTFYYKQ